MKHDITPKNLILGLLQASMEGESPVKSLVKIGELFGFSSNTIRVAATRLIREGKLENNERGLYRLNKQDDHFSRFVESWRTGEDRLLKWDGSWMCHLSPPLSARQLEKNKRILVRPGFQEGCFNLWVRPNNLKIGIEGIEKILRQLSIIAKGELFVGREFSRMLTERWKRYLWPTAELISAQRKCLEKMNKSADRLLKMPLENALVESFLIGSEAIYLLITDPLLPDELMDNAHRIELTQTMLEYDVLGKIVWRDKFGGLGIEKTPRHSAITYWGIKLPVID